MQRGRRSTYYPLSRKKFGYPIGPDYEQLIDSNGNAVVESNGQFVYVLTSASKTLGIERSICNVGYSIPRRDFGIPTFGQPPPHYGQKLDPDGNPETDPDGNYIYVPI